jgi:hypothetical protein
MSRDWKSVRNLETVNEIRAYLREVYGIRLSRSTVYEYAKENAFVPLPLHPASRPKRGKGTRGLIAIVVIDEWVEARFHLRELAATPTASRR